MNTFSAGASLRAGWEIFKKRPGFFIAIALGVMVASIVINSLSQVVAGQSMLSGVINFLLQTLVGMGTVAFSLKAYEDAASADVKDLWHPQDYLNYLLASIAVMVAVMVGFVLLIVPGVIVAIMFSMTKYLVISRNMKPIDAIKESMRMTAGSRLELFLLCVAVIGINIVGALCLVVGLLVTVPVSMLAFVSAFRTLEQKASAMATTTA